MDAVLRSAVDLGALKEVLTQANVFWKGLPYLPILIGHSLFCTSLAPEAKQHFLLHYWLTYLGGFAGGIWSSLLLMNPARAPISILAGNTGGIVWTLCWWIMTYSPIAGILNRIHELRPVKALTKTCVQFMRASLIMARVQLAGELYPGVYLAPIIVGTVSACGGKTTYDAIRHVYGFSPGPCEITVPSGSFRTAFLGSVLYYLGCVCPLTRVLTPEQGSGAILSLFVAQTLFSELTGITTDWSELLLRAVLKISNIPYPKGVPKALPATHNQPASVAPSAPAKLQNGYLTKPITTTSTSTVNVVAANGIQMQQLHTKQANGVANGHMYTAGGDGGRAAGSDGSASDAAEDSAPAGAAVAAAPRVDVDTIRAALQRSAGGGAAGKEGKGGAGGGGGGKSANGGWQVVQGRKKAPATKDTADKKTK